MKFLSLIALFLISVLQAQGFGEMRGVVKDAKSGDPLIGVNIMVKGTYYGAASDLQGQFRLLNMNPGSYDVEASMIGYKVVLHTGVTVLPAKTVELNFELEGTVLTLGEEVVVVGKKPLFDADETSSMVRVSSDDIADKVVSSVEDILAEQIGVTSQDNEIHIRGGRIDESLFVVDGLSIKDPLSGYSGNLFINAEAIEDLEIITGGYSAEYGQAMSGVVNVKLKEGRDHFEGALKYVSDNWGMSQDDFTNYKSDRMEFNLGGPDILLELLPKIFGLDLPGKFSFFLNGFGKVYDSHLPTAQNLYPHRSWSPPPGVSDENANNIMRSFAQRENNDWHFLYKLSWKISPKKSLMVSYDMSLNVNQGFFMPRAFSNTYYPYRYQEILDYYNTITRDSRLFNLSWTHTLSTRSFYEITMGRFVTLEHSAVQDLHWTDYRQRLDLEPINYIFTDSDGNVRITYGNEFYDSGFGSEWYDIVSDNTRIDADWTYRLGTRNKIKAGFEHTLTQLQVLDIDEPWAGTTGLGSNYDMYKASTSFGAFFVQDRITFEGMTMNLGIRYDYWFPGTYVEDAVADEDNIIITEAARQKFNNETFEFFGNRGKGRLSPRFGISHPVTDNDVLYFYYGHFSQLPTFQYVYAKLNSKSQSTYQVFGNPNLNPKTTVQYELGIKHRFSEDQVLELKAYWKDMFDYETSQTIALSDPRYSHLRFNMYFNADYARSRGVEFILKSRIFQNWYADVNFNYSIVTGKSSSPLDNLLVQAGAISEKPLGEAFMSWDRPLQSFANLSYKHPSGWGISTRIEYGSNRRYTRSIPDTTEYENGVITVDGREYYIGTRDGDNPYLYFSDYRPKFFEKTGINTILGWFGVNPVSGTSSVDIKAYKNFKIRGINLKIFLESENIFEETIPRRINSFTGHGYDPGEIIPYSLIDQPNPNVDPSRYSRPRTMELGIQVIF